MGVGLALLAACAKDSRYRMLKFFFDGVPTVAEQQTTTSLVSARKRPFTFPHRPPTAPAAPTALPAVSIHKPFAERKCTACHDMSAGGDALTRNLNLCDRCHQEERVNENWAHGPINLGQCMPCHRAHQSPYPHLLDEPMPNLCLRCHEDTLDRKTQYHNVANLAQCTHCHDAHRASTTKAKTS
jgi:predicted CXXCH cytochrome family protein